MHGLPKLVLAANSLSIAIKERSEFAKESEKLIFDAYQDLKESFDEDSSQYKAIKAIEDNVKSLNQNDELNLEIAKHLQSSQGQQVEVDRSKPESSKEAVLALLEAVKQHEGSNGATWQDIIRY